LTPGKLETSGTDNGTRTKRWLNDAFARLNFNHQPFDPIDSVSIILVPDEIRVSICITFFTKKQEPALGRAFKVGFEDSRGNDHWENREA